MKAPEFYDGKTLQYEETFRSAFARSTEEDALRTLNWIRQAHNSDYGWVEIEGFVHEAPNGFVAVRHHAIYR